MAQGDWSSLGTPTGNALLTERFTIGTNQDGRQEVFAAGSDGNLWQIWQVSPNSEWSAWKKLGRPPPGLRGTDRITVGANEDGRQELFAMGQDDALWHVWQVAPNVGWSDWKSLGKPRDTGFPEPENRDISNPIVKRNADGHLEVFAPGNGAFCNRWQEVWRDGPDKVVWRHQGWNAKPRPRPDVGITWLDAALNLQDRLEVVAFGDDGALWHAWQVDVPPFWSAWKSLGTPATGIRTTDRLTIGVNADGRLEVFVVGQNGDVWHIWQTR
jgi:hypothetical protein